MELASAPRSEWQLLFSAHISCIYEGKIPSAPCGSCARARGGEGRILTPHVLPWGSWFSQNTAAVHTITTGHRGRPTLLWSNGLCSITCSTGHG